MKKRIVLIFLLISLFSVSLMAFFIMPAGAAIIRVPQDVPTIQMAVNLAYPGDIIQVSAGTYYEHVNITKPLTLTGVGGVGNTIIDGNGTGYVVYITADNVQIDGFTIQRGDRGICIRYSVGSVISNNIVSNNRVGIYLSSGSSGNTVSNNTVTFNYDYGIRIYDSSGNLVTGNTVSNNYCGISLSSYSSGNEVGSNEIANCQYGIRVYNSTSNTFSGNILLNNNYGMYLSSNSTGNLISGNTFSGNFYGIQLWESGGNTLRTNTVSGGSYNFWVYGSTLMDYVQDIDASNTVNSKPIYYWVNRAGGAIPSDAGYVAVINSTNVVVRGLSLTNNYHGVLFAYTTNSIIENVVASYNVYGIKLFRSSGIQITSNTVTFNKDFGIRLYRSNSTTISDNTIESNMRYGIFLYYSAGNTLTNNSMLDNKYNFGVDGDSLLHYIQSIDATNTVNGKPIYYWINQHNRQVPADAGYVAIINSTNIAVKNLTITNNEHGVLLAYTNSSSIQNVNALNNQLGIEIKYSTSNTITSNAITSSVWHGIYLYSSTNHILINNNMFNNTYNFGVYGTSLSHFIHNIDTSNKVNGKPIYYWVNQHNRQVPADAGYVAAINSTNIDVKDLTLTENYQGVLLAYTTGSTIQNVNASSNRFGIYLDHSKGNSITSNTVFKNHYRGIYLYSSNSNSLNYNTVTLNEVGIKIHWYSQDNIIRGNTILNNDLGVSLDTSSNNKIYHNNFINNTDQAYQDMFSFNTWDDGYPSGGNYWSDYNGMDLYSGPYQNETGSDGIGDTPYIIDENNQDRYPLVNPWAIHDVSIINVTFSKEYPKVNETIFIYVRVQNKGHFTETFDVSLNYTRTLDPLIGTQTIMLAPGESIQLNFTWTPNATGRYEIKAYTSTIPEDVNPSDNTKIVYLYVTTNYTSTSSTEENSWMDMIRSGRFYYRASSI